MIKILVGDAIKVLRTLPAESCHGGKQDAMTEWEHDFNAWLLGLAVPPYGIDAERKRLESMMRMAYRAGWYRGTDRGIEMFRPMTNEQAEKVLRDTPESPLSREEIDDIVRRVTGK